MPRSSLSWHWHLSVLLVSLQWGQSLFSLFCKCFLGLSKAYNKWDVTRLNFTNASALVAAFQPFLELGGMTLTSLGQMEPWMMVTRIEDGAKLVGYGFEKKLKILAIKDDVKVLLLGLGEEINREGSARSFQDKAQGTRK
uniref:Peptidase M17 leucyl aminopeptidase N-terminal domain-containing protein n=1 Tax=Lactuca sativa TaxID=4236 RepID=A0A9R1W8I5_LACSA|nr:hypothetical protein LSAT_V11C200091450 [Lactuca sativa]